MAKVTRRISSPELVERSGQLALLDSAWQHAAAGRPRVVLVRGEAGVGKTRLVGAFESRLPAAALVLHGACVRLGREVAAFTPFRGVLGELVDRWGPDRVRSLAAGSAPALTALVPDLAESPVPEAGDTYDAVARLLDRASREQPLVAVVEDLHWADDGTLEMVDYLSRALRSSRLLMVTTLRAGMGDGSPAEALAGELMTLARVDTVDVSPLSAAGVRHQLRGILGRPPPVALADRIVTRSQGVPFLVEELAAAEAEGEHGVPDALRDVLLLRTSGLSATATTVLRAVAVARHPVDDSTLVRVCDLDGAGMDIALGELRDAGLLVFDRADGTADFRHALLREAVESQLVPGESGRLHRRYAELLDADSTENASHRAIEAADHWFRAGDVAHARRASLAAAGTAHEFGLYREEWQLLSRVLQLPEDRGTDLDGAPARVGLLHSSGVAACNTGEYAAGYDLLDSAVRMLDLRRDAAQCLEILQDMVAHLVGTAPEGVDDSVEAGVRTALAALPDQPSRARMMGLWALAVLHLHRGDRQSAWDELHEAIACADAVGDPLRGARLRVLLAAYFAGSWIAPAEGRDLYAHARRVARGHADHQLELVSLINEVDFLVNGSGQYAEAERVARTMLSAAETLAGAATATDQVIGNLAEALWATGGWAEAVDRLTAAVEVDRPSVEHGGLYMLLAATSLALGDLVGARAAAAEARERFSRGGTAPQYVVAQAAVEAEIALSDDRPAEAVGLASDAFHAHWQHTWGSRSCALIDVAARASRLLPPSAGELTAWLRPARDAISEDAPQGAVVGWLPILAAEISDDHNDWEAALEAVTHCEVPVLVALRTRVGAARALLTAGRRGPGEDVLREAADRADALHARGLAAEIGELAARFRLPGFADSTPVDLPRILAALTPRELEVLRLVAAGHSNGRIAAELFISVKTASIHVSHILAKLDVRSRGEAAAIAWRDGLTVPAAM